MEFLLDYHIIFLVMTFIIFIISILLLFSDDITLVRAVGANVLIFFNMILNLIVSQGFGAIDVYGYDSDGLLVHNVTASMHPFVYIYWLLFYVNLFLLFYCVYFYYKKPWEEHVALSRNKGWDDF